MKKTARILGALLGIVLILTAVGCPKKAVKVEEPIPPPPPPEPEEPVLEEPKLEINLNTIYFDFDKYDIRSGDAEVLKANAQQLNDAAAKDQKPGVVVEGHCCPIGTSEYNMALGQRRAEAAKAYLVKLGVSADQLSTLSYGEERLATQVEAEYDKNRRCEFKTGR